jgi:polysaccharide deacetylase family protein (PEP-CTERM system associated)
MMPEKSNDEKDTLGGTGILNVLSFEVEDRVHVDSPDYEPPEFKSRIIPILIHLLDLLDNQKARATFFVLGWVARRFPEIVALIDARGHEVASHGHTHSNIDTMPEDMLGEGLQRSKTILEEILQKPIHGYKAAGESPEVMKPAVIKLIAEAGYSYFFSPTTLLRSAELNAPQTVGTGEDKSILLIPHSVYRKFGISVRFSERLRTYPAWFVQRAINRLNNKGRSAIINLRLWELDRHQQRPVNSHYTIYSQYGNLSLTEEKLSRLLDMFEFTTFADTFAIED